MKAQTFEIDASLPGVESTVRVSGDLVKTLSGLDGGRPVVHFEPGMTGGEATLRFSLDESATLSLCGLAGACVVTSGEESLPTRRTVNDDGRLELLATLQVEGGALPRRVRLDFDPAVGAAGRASATFGQRLETSGDVVQVTFDRDGLATVTAGGVGGPAEISFILDEAQDLERCAGMAGVCVVKANLAFDLPTRREVLADGRVRHTAMAELVPGAVDVFQLQASETLDPPLALNDFAATDEDVPVIIDVLQNDSDPNGDPLAVIAVSTPFGGAAEIQPDNTVLYTPRADRSGYDSFRYTVSDGRGGLDEGRVSLDVAPVDDPPRPRADSATVAEDQAVQIAVLANDSDPEYAPLEVIFVGPSASGTAQIQPDNTVLYTPSADFFGLDSLTYTVSDGALTATSTINVSVTAVADDPQAVDDAFSTTEDVALDLPVLQNDVDPDRGLLTVSSLAPGPHGSVQVVNGGTAVRYTPWAGFSGPDYFYYTVQNQSGRTDEALVTVEVMAGNRAPIAREDSVSLLEDEPGVVIPVLANDEDPDLDTLSLILVGPAASSTPQILPDQTVLYTPAPDFFGEDVFTYTISDGVATASASVRVTVTGVPDFPVAVDDTATVTMDGQVVVPVLHNDRDPDGGSLTVTALSPPSGTAQIRLDGTVLYTPPPLFTGVDTFYYTVQNTSGEIATAQVTISVTSPGQT